MFLFYKENIYHKTLQQKILRKITDDNNLKALNDAGYGEAARFLKGVLLSDGYDVYNDALLYFADNVNSGYRTQKQKGLDAANAVREGLHEVAPYVGAAVYGPGLAYLGGQALGAIYGLGTLGASAAGPSLGLTAAPAAGVNLS